MTTTASLDLAPRRPPRLAVLVTSFAFMVTMMGTTLPTPLYSIYSTELAFSPLVVTVLFAVYALGVVAALSLFGRLSDDLGRRPVLMLAVVFAILSAILFLLPSSLPLLVVARIVSGLGAGLMSGAGTAAVIDLFPAPKKGAAGALAVAVNTGGLAVGTLLAGLLADSAADPLVLPFAVHLSLGVLAFVGLLIAAPVSARSRERIRIRPRRLRVPIEIRGAFVRAVLAAGSGFAVTGVLTAVSAVFLATGLRLPSHTLAGCVVFLAFACMAIGQLIARRVRPHVALLVGCIGLVLAAGLLAAALGYAELEPLLAAAIVLGLSSGMCMNAGIATTVEQVQPAQRGEVSSSFFAGLYLMLAIPAIGVGVLTSLIGLRPAGLVFCAIVAVLALTVAVIELCVGRTPRHIARLESPSSD